MVSAILSVLAAAFGFLGKLWGWLSQQQLIQAGRDQANLSSLQKQKEAADEATKAREDAHGKWVASSDAERMSVDPFSRD
jgi:hypothetical protein